MKILEYSERTFYIEGLPRDPTIYYTIGANGAPQFSVLRLPTANPTVPATKLPKFFTRDVLRLVFSEYGQSIREVLYRIVSG